MTEPVYVRVSGNEHVPGQINYWLWCPACQDAVRITNAWSFDGNLLLPTFAPSILATGYYGTEDGGRVETRCHSYLQQGIWRFLDDCTHAHAGEKMPVEPLPAWLLPTNDSEET